MHGPRILFNKKTITFLVVYFRYISERQQIIYRKQEMSHLELAETACTRRISTYCDTTMRYASFPLTLHLSSLRIWMAKIPYISGLDGVSFQQNSDLGVSREHLARFNNAIMQRTDDIIFHQSRRLKPTCITTPVFRVVF